MTVLSRSGRSEAGYASLELVVMTPILVAFLLVAVGLGRVSHGRQLVAQAAAAAARAAALDDTPGQAQSDARTEATGTLAQAGISCRSVSVAVDTARFYAGGQVSVTVSCQASLAGLTVVGFPGTTTLTASAAAPLETYRDLTGGPP